MIRQYQSSDTETLISIWMSASKLAHPFLGDDFLTQEAINMRTLYLPNAETWVIEHTTVPIGFIALIGSEIGGLFLDPAYHGQGYGHRMVDHAWKLKGPLRVDIFERNTIGRRFYDRTGFKQTGQYLHEASGEIILTMTMPSTL
ncbi:GNAT family N-acetyltransferase [Nisaea sp.]